MSGCGMRFVLRLRTDADTANWIAPCSDSYAKNKNRTGESRIWRQGQVFPEQFDLILDYLVNLKYCFISIKIYIYNV